MIITDECEELNVDEIPELDFKGKLIFCSTPKGKSYLYSMYKKEGQTK